MICTVYSSFMSKKFPTHAVCLTSSILFTCETDNGGTLREGIVPFHRASGQKTQLRKSDLQDYPKRSSNILRADFRVNPPACWFLAKK
jgi:hypothetical protein